MSEELEVCSICGGEHDERDPDSCVNNHCLCGHPIEAHDKDGICTVCRCDLLVGL